MIFNIFVVKNFNQVSAVDVISDISAMRKNKDDAIVETNNNNNKTTDYNFKNLLNLSDKSFSLLLLKLVPLTIEKLAVNAVKLPIWAAKAIFLKVLPGFLDIFTNEKSAKIQGLTEEVMSLRSNLTAIQSKLEKESEGDASCQKKYDEIKKIFFNCLTDENCTEALSKYIDFDKKLLTKISKEELGE